MDRNSAGINSGICIPELLQPFGENRRGIGPLPVLDPQEKAF
jgi:hypothetical protein